MADPGEPGRQRASGEGSRPGHDPRLEIPEALKTPVRVPESLQRERAKRASGAATDGDRKQTMRLWAAGMNFVGAVAAGCVAGYVVDRWQGTNPWGVLVGSALGLVGGFWALMREMSKIDGGGK
jgi:F0F1-type ATP synthase assembly protein I